MRQNFEFNLRILGNIRIKTQKSTDFGVHFQKTTVFFGFFNKDYTFYNRNLYFTTKDAQSFVKISFLVTSLHF